MWKEHKNEGGQGEITGLQEGWGGGGGGQEWRVG